MSAAARDMEAKIVRIIYDAGGRLLEKGKDGAGHRTATYEINGHQSRFHYPSSPQANGCGHLNCYTRLRREIREIKSRIPVEIAPEKPAEALPAPLRIIGAPPARATPPAPQKANKPDRKHVIKRYLSLRSLDLLCEELGMSRDAAIQTIMSSRADAATFLRREIDAKRSTASHAPQPKRVNPFLLVPKERRQLAKLAHRLYFKEGRTAAEASRILKVSTTTVINLAQEA